MDDQKNIRPDFSKAGTDSILYKKGGTENGKRKVKGTAWNRQSVVSGSILWVADGSGTGCYRNTRFSDRPLCYTKGYSTGNYGGECPAVSGQ